MRLKLPWMKKADARLTAALALAAEAELVLRLPLFAPCPIHRQDPQIPPDFPPLVPRLPPPYPNPSPNRPKPCPPGS